MTTIPAQPGSAHDAAGHDHDQAGEAGHAGDHGHGAYPFLAHHFETPAQQFDSGKLGMWLFLATEVLFFGGLFVWYVVLRSLHPEVFTYASGYLDTLLGGINTAVLILSSLTMATAVRFAQTDNRRGLIIMLFLTFLGAVGFLVIKKIEYTHKWHEHLLWGARFYEPPHGEHGEAHADHAPAAAHEAGESHAVATAPAAAGAHASAPSASTPATEQAGAAQPSTGVAAALPRGSPTPAGSNGMPAFEASTVKPAAPAPAGLSAIDPALEHTSHGPVVRTEAHLEDPRLPPNTHLFFGVYFCMTGLHAIHVIVGMIVIGWLIIGAWRGKFSSQYYTPVDLGGLYWHIVDLIWIFLFPLFYIIH